MSQVVIPKLRYPICHFGACVMDSEANSLLLDWLKVNSIEDSVAAYQEDGEDRWLIVTMEQYDETTSHLHVEITSHNPEVDSLRNLSDIIGLLTEFVGKCKSDEGEPYIQSRVRFEISRDEVPEHGMVAHLLGFKRKSCGAKLSLSSASLEIDDEVFDSLSFRYNRDNNNVVGELWASGPVDLDVDYLLHFSQLTSIGIDNFLLERLSREEANA